MKMKKYILFTFLILSQFIIFSCNKTIELEQEGGNVDKVNGYITYKGENFTGTLISRYPGTSQLKFKIEVKNGLGHGKTISYYENGQIDEDFEEIYGLKNGVYLKYWKNGRIKEKGNYISGDEDGVNEHYDENGTITNYHKYSNKTLIDSRAYTNGEIFYHYFEKGDSAITERYTNGKLDSREVRKLN